MTVDIDGILDAIADRIADRIAERDASLVSQRDPRGLGGRRHIEVVRRRIAEKAGGAYKKGRDYLLTPVAVREELERFGTDAGNDNVGGPRRPRKTTAKAGVAAEHDELMRLKRELEADMRAARR